MSDRQLIADLLSALEYHTEQTRPIEFSRVAIEAAREYLRKPAQQQEWRGPVDWEAVAADYAMTIAMMKGAQEAAVLAEREACARVCDEQGIGRKALEHYAALTYSGAAHDCAAAIRARGQA